MNAALHPQFLPGDTDGRVLDGRWEPTDQVTSGRPTMTAVPAVPAAFDVEYVTTRGPWTFTRQTSMDARLITEFYELYRLAFDPLKKRAVARQVLTWDEFCDQMNDQRVVKYIARDAAGEALGLTTLTNELESIPWISPEYFAEHFPDHSARKAVYYLGFTLAHPSQRHLRFVETIVMVGMQSLAFHRAVIAYDVCAFNNLELRFNERIADALRKFPTAKLELMDTQSYSCVTFA